MTSLWRDSVPPASHTPLDYDREHEILVVGAGLTGLMTALLLVRAGRDVTVIEGEEIGALASGGNTGKATLLQGAVFSRMRSGHPASLVRAYVDANRAGQEWVREFAEQSGVPFSVRTAYSYAQGADGVDTARGEYDAAKEAGLAVRWLDAPDEPVPFPVAGAVALDDQVAIDPLTLAGALAWQIRKGGGRIHTGVRATDVTAFPHVSVETGAGRLRAQTIILATGTPITDRGLTFAKTRGMRSSCIAFTAPGPMPAGMYISVDEPSRSIRSVTASDGPVDRAQLVVGGAGHPVGRAESSQQMQDELLAWSQQHFDGVTEAMRWSAQDYESHNLVPFVGAMPRGFGRIRFATGYGKWGLTNAPAAAMRLAAEVLGEPLRDRPKWMLQLATRMTVPSDLARGASEGLKVGVEAVTGWARAETTAVPVPQPAEGCGVVAQRAGHPVAISTVEGTTRAVSAVCPHLGGILAWNDAEKSWDCPLHASRFTATGTRIEGPAQDDLAPVE